MKRTTLLGLVLILGTGVTTASLMGCASMFRGRSGGSSSSSSSDAEYTGMLTFQNQSSEAICGIELKQRDHYAIVADRVEPGASVDLSVESEAEQLFVTACDGESFLYADQIDFDSATYAFSDSTISRQSFQERLNYLRRLNRMNINPAMQDSSLRAQMHAAVLRKAENDRWSDTPSVTLIQSDQWSILRNNLTGIITGRRIAGVVGHRFPDGHCSIQIHTFYEGHDGSNFTGSVRYEGTAGNIYTSQTMVSWMEQQAGGGGGSASSGTSSGGGCTNTCRSANDGECDDGGPGSLYSVCALGTDCSDCGPR